MTIIGIDIGKKGGYSVNRDGQWIECETFAFDSLLLCYKFFGELIRTYKPDMVITGKPNKMYNIILRHAQFIGILSLLCEKNNIPVVMVNDTTARVAVLGKGHGFHKELIHAKYKAKTQDISDSMSFVDWYLINNS